MGFEARIDDRRADGFETLGNGQRATAMLSHPQGEVREALIDIEGGPRIHRRTEQHDSTRMQVHELKDEIFGCTHGTRDHVAGAIDEFGQRVDHDIRT